MANVQIKEEDVKKLYSETSCEEVKKGLETLFPSLFKEYNPGTIFYKLDDDCSYATAMTQAEIEWRDKKLKKFFILVHATGECNKYRYVLRNMHSGQSVLSFKRENLCIQDPKSGEENLMVFREGKLFSSRY